MGISIYIAGPISADIGVSMEEKLARFWRAEEWLSTQREISEVLNPLRTGNGTCDGDCNPDGHVGQDGERSHAWECYMKHDLVDLLKCQAIALLPGFEESRGAMIEFRLAQDLGMKRWYLNEYGENMNRSNG